jgi:hypothetical protein
MTGVRRRVRRRCHPVLSAAGLCWRRAVGSVDSKLGALQARLDESARRIGDLELKLTSRLDSEQGSRAGGQESRGEARAVAVGRQASNGQTMQFAGLVLLALAIVASVLVAVLHKG